MASIRNDISAQLKLRFQILDGGSGSGDADPGPRPPGTNVAAGHQNDL